MRMQLVVRREEPGSDAVWVVTAADEFTLDEWNGVPDFIKQALDEDPANTRTMWVDLPDDALQQAFAEPTVTGTVTS